MRRLMVSNWARMAANGTLSDDGVSIARRSPFDDCPHSHSIVLNDDNALTYQGNFFRHAAKNRLADPSKIRALEFKSEFRRFRICSVSGTIGIDRSIFADSTRTTDWTGPGKKTVSPRQRRSTG